jgi:tetratricopeptide (TPR) repeat protein
MAHWLAATVQVARQAFRDAERELAAGLRAQEHEVESRGRFTAVALHYLAGLLHLRRADDAAALTAFERELAAEVNGHLYARECCANTYYAIGVLHLRYGRVDASAAALNEALTRIPNHALARVVLAHLCAASGAQIHHPSAQPPDASPVRPRGMDAAFATAATLVLRDRIADAAAAIEHALDGAEAGSAGWLLPVEPLLQPASAPGHWAGALARLGARAA